MYFTACTSNTYGVNCTETCDCIASHTNNVDQTCDTVTGACDCESGWNGPRCEEDINECAENTHGCESKPNQGCHNTNGSFECSCELGYTKDVADNCVQSKSTVL